MPPGAARPNFIAMPDAADVAPAAEPDCNPAGGVRRRGWTLRRLVPGQFTPARPVGDSAFAAAVLIAWLAVVAVTSYRHEPWRDEADRWLVARDRSVSELLGMTGRMGTPAIWYLMLMPLAKAGLPYGSMKVLHVAVSAAAVWVVLRHAPFRRPTRVLLACSHFLLFEYAVVSANYAVAMLLLFIAAAAWGRRLERPMRLAIPVALLPSTTAHMAFVAAAIGLVFLVDLAAAGRRDGWSRLAVLIMLVGGLIGLAQFIPLGGGQRAEWLMVRHADAPRQVIAGLFPSPRFGGAARPSFAVGLAFLASFLAMLAFKPRLALLFLLSLAGLSYIFVFKWINGLRHPGLVFLLVVFVFWVWRSEDRQAFAAAAPTARRRLGTALASASFALFHVGLCLSALSGLAMCVWDVRYQYSHARQMAWFLEANGLKDRPICMTLVGEPVVPYLPNRPVFYADIERLATHRNWDAEESARGSRPASDAAASAVRHRPEAEGLLVLVHSPLPDPAGLGLTPLYATRGIVGPGREVFYLYERRNRGAAN